MIGSKIKTSLSYQVPRVERCALAVRCADGDLWRKTHEITLV
ncbi:hypothetical protein AWB79_00037 [Caballeronia hypogeia]|uniref:Uncharacterized protein n=1 Tax=Caballeronia hypogeia TaxID=1777140 RepID=A0A157Z0K3_9BURK|nr:hypothetical protein AWB79_00037 [Caballeronia hypogeia]